jgi:hypothetical protein
MKNYYHKNVAAYDHWVQQEKSGRREISRVVSSVRVATCGNLRDYKVTKSHIVYFNTYVVECKYNIGRKNDS